MFARIVEFSPKPEMKDEIVNVLRQEVLPIRWAGGLGQGGRQFSTRVKWRSSTSGRRGVHA
jgi:hypothetical protein